MAKRTPIIFWASQPVNPGEVVMLYGGPFAADDEVMILRLPDGALRGSAAPATKPPVPVKPTQVSESCLKFVLPANLKPGVFACGVRGGTNTIVLNRPNALWVQGDAGVAATRGGWVRIFGNCLQLGSRKPTVCLRRMVGDQGTSVDLRVVDASPYSVTASLPEWWGEGDYEVAVHNSVGSDDEWGWSYPLKIRIVPRPSWKATVFNVRDLGAAGTGEKDDTPAIKQALAKAASNGGGVVYLPRGRYQVTETLVVPRLTVLRGEARELTTLFWPDREQSLDAIIRGSNSFALEDLTINCYNYKSVIAADLGDKPDAGDVFLRRLRVRAMLYRPLKDPALVDKRFRETLELSTGGADTVRMGGRNIEITDCDLYGSGRALFLSRVRGGRVAGNVFHNGRWGWYCISGSDGLIFEHNEIAGGDLMSTGGGLNCLDGSSYSQNIYFAHNRLHDMYGWDREALTSDAGGGAYFGGVESANGANLVLADDPKWGGHEWIGAAVFILDGRGAGQYRRIVGFDGKNVKLEALWDIAPGKSSFVSITMLQRNYLIIGNDFRDATVGVQCYGISIGHIIAGNTSTRAGGFHNLGLFYAGGYQPSWFVQYFDNKIAEGNGINGPLNEFPPLDSHLAIIGGQQDPYRGPLARAGVMRRNRLLSNARIEVRGMCADVVIENNQVENADVGIRVEPSASGVVLHGNRCTKVGRPIDDAGGKAIRIGRSRDRGRSARELT